MASPVQALFSGQLGSGAVRLYASAAGIWTQITKNLCVNTAGSPQTVTFYVVPSGGTTGTSTLTTVAEGILAGASWQSPNEPGLVLNPGDAIWGLASNANDVNCYLAGVMVSA